MNDLDLYTQEQAYKEAYSRGYNNGRAMLLYFGFWKTMIVTNLITVAVCYSVWA